jgi:hypothetical protein
MVPNVSNVLNGWMKRYAITTFIQDVDPVSHRPVETPTIKYLMLNKQPTPPQIVMRKPEEQRKWKFWDIFTKKSIELNIDDRFEIEGIGYRIKEKYPWNESGYFHYSCIEDYAQENTITT